MLLLSNVNATLVLVLSACTFESEGKAKCCKCQTWVLTINIVTLMFELDDNTQWDSWLSKKNFFYSKFTQTNTKGEDWKGSDVANLPHLMVAGLLQLAVSPSWPSALELSKHGWGKSLRCIHLKDLLELADSNFLSQNQLTFSRVEDTVGLSVTHVTALGLAVMLKRAGLTKIVPAPKRHLTGYQIATGNNQGTWRSRGKRSLLCNDGILEGLPADEALKGQILVITAHLIVLII